MAQPDGAHTGRGNEDAALAQLIADPNLPMCRLLGGIGDDGVFSRVVGTVFQIGFAPVGIK